MNRWIPIIAVLLTCPGQATAFEFHLINNGLAPPNPANDINPSIGSDFWFIRNVGCPPGFPGSDIDAPCPSPGAPTEVAFGGATGIGGVFTRDTSVGTINGGWYFGTLSAYDASTLEFNDGMSVGPLDAYGSARIIMNGGSVRHVSVYNDSVGEVRGGSPTEYLFARDDASLIVYGNSFAIDGSPVPYGPAPEGVLTGNLVNGDPIDIPVTLLDNGTLTLLPMPVPPVPSLYWGALWTFAVALCVVGFIGQSRIQSHA